MSFSDTFAPVIDSIYDAAFDASRWPGVVKAVANASGGYGGALALWDLEKRQPPMTYNQGFPEPLWDNYTQDLIARDPLAHAFAARPDIDIYTGEMLISADVMQNDEVRKYVRRYCDQRFCYGARLFASNGLESTLLLARSANQGPAEQRDIERLAFFLPHLRRSITIGRKIGERMSAAILDAMSFGVVVLNELGQVSFANKMMSQIAAEQDGVSLGRSGLVLADKEEDAAYRRLIDAVRRKAYFAAHFPKTALSATRILSRRPYSIVVSPFPAADTVFPRSASSVLICVSDPARTSHLTGDLLAALFDLSPAEARLTINLVQFGSLNEAARACGLTDGSARQYMKRIFTKTGTRSQVELVALIMGSARL